MYPQGYYDDPRLMTPEEQSAWATNIGTSGIGLAEGESVLSLFARRLEFNNAPMMMDNFLNGRMVDWNDATFRTGFNQDYNASISGATERVNYYLSLGYVNNEGAVQGNEYNAFRSNMKINAKITDWLEIGANVNFRIVQMAIFRFRWEAIIGMPICCVTLHTLLCMMRMEIMNNILCLVCLLMVVITTTLTVNTMIWKKVTLY